MGGLFYLLTLYGVIRGASAARAKGWYFGAVAACALGAATKEVLATAPVIVLVYDRVFLSGSFKEALRRRWGLYVALAATWGLLAALMLLSEGRAGSAGFGYGMGWWEYARTQFGFLVGYLRLSFWPDPLVLDYGIDTERTAGEIVPYAIIVAVLVAATAVALVRRPWLGFLGAWFFTILAPSSSFIPLITQIAAEHRMYLPLAAVVTLVVIGGYIGGTWLLARIVASDSRRRTVGAALAVVLVAALVAALGYLTYRRNLDYSSDLAVWVDTALKRPTNARAQYTAGNCLASRDRLDEAVQRYKAALALDPAYVDAHNNLASVYVKQKKLGEAEAEFREAVRLKPDYAVVYYNRGVAYQTNGLLDQAVQDYTRAIALQPDDAAACNNRGITYRLLGRYDEAIGDFTRALELKPDFPPAYGSRGVAYQNKGLLDPALQDYTRAVELDPYYAEAYYNRGTVWQAKGLLDQAIGDYTRAIQLQGDFALAYNNRGMVLQMKGLLDQAVRDYTRAIDLAPHEPLAYQNRAVSWWRLKEYDKAWADVRACRRAGGTPDPRFIKDLAQSSGRSE